MTRTEVSRAAGLAPTFLRDLFPERDAPPRKKSVSYDNLKAIADVLQTTPEWLAEGRGEEELKAGAEIIGIIPYLRKDDRSRLAEFARFLAEQAKKNAPSN